MYQDYHLVSQTELLGFIFVVRIIKDTSIRRRAPHVPRTHDNRMAGRQMSCRQMMILLLLFLQKQSLAFAVYLFGIGTLHTGPGLKKKAHVIMLSP